MSRKTKRLEETIKEKLAILIEQQVKDPRIDFVTITDVEVASDLRHANIYISVMGEEDKVREALAGLESAKGFLKRHLGKELRVKYLPELSFKYEQTAREALRLQEIMKNVDGLEREDC
ncbi:MAG: 30S ribosome-binding factor RbfA [Actinomycetota bacterium]|nr:30S ribosome-binding factor RbfA [Actinomycetota bacterium]